MKQDISKLFLAIIFLILLTIIVRIPMIMLRSLPAHDEAISYLAAAGKQDEYSQDVTDGKIIGKYISASVFKKYMIPVDPYSYWEVSRSMGFADVHPPFFYDLLRTWVYFTGVDLSINLILNLILAAITAILIFYYAYYLTNSYLFSILITVLWIFSPSASATAALRHYQLLELISVAFVFYLDKTTKKLQPKPFEIALAGIIGGFGLTTHVLFFIVLISAILFSAVRYIFIWKKFPAFLVSMLLIIFIVAVIIFPYYPGAFVKNLSKAQKAQETSIGKRQLLWSKSVKELFSYKLGEKSEDYKRAHPFRFLLLSYFLLFVIAILIIASILWSKERNYFPLLYLISGIAAYQYLYLNAKIPLWSVGGYYFVLFYPFVGLSLASAAGKEFKTKVFASLIAVLMLLTSVYFFINFYFEQRDQISPGIYSSLKVELRNLKRIVIDNPARGDFFRVIYSSPNKTLIYLDSQEGLMKKTAWMYSLEEGDAYLSILTYKSTKENQEKIRKMFEENTGHILLSGPKILGPFQIYLVKK